MHESAMEFGAAFFDIYMKDVKGLTIVDIGAQDVNGTLKSVSLSDNNYIGVDFIPAKGVDIVIKDLYSLPFDDSSVDVVVSSSCFEHSEFFWLLFNEMLRILKPDGLIYINAPSNGTFHRYPIDCWRFYPDSGVALQNWGRRSGYNCVLLESFIGLKKTEIWNDFVAVFLKDENYAFKFVDRIQNKLPQYVNGRSYNSEVISKFVEPSQDEQAYKKLSAIINAINQIMRQ